VLSIKELRTLASSLTSDQFRAQLGPFALVSRPPDAVAAQMALKLAARRTVATRHGAPDETLSLLFEFDNLEVATLPPLDEDGTITIGRLPDCELVIDDPSVSKHHARIFWNEAAQRAAVEDLASSNGTFLGPDELHMRWNLKDGDLLAFGDVRFCYLLSSSLYSKLKTGHFPAPRAT
jgi:hypothetical protein